MSQGASDQWLAQASSRRPGKNGSVARELDGVTGGRHALAVNVAVPQSDGVFNRSQAVPAPSIIEGTTMDYYAGIDVSLESSSLCVVDATGRVVREAKIASEPEALTAWLKNLGLEIVRIGLEAGPLSQWLYAGMKQAGLPAELLEPRPCSPPSRSCR